MSSRPAKLWHPKLDVIVEGILGGMGFALALWLLKLFEGVLCAK